MAVQHWLWDERKDQANLIKHKIPFELAIRVFNDPLHVTVSDPCEDEERWRTFGQIQGVLILVVHTEPDEQAGGRLRPGRIISARRATSNERRLFEETVYDC